MPNTVRVKKSVTVTQYNKAFEQATLKAAATNLAIQDMAEDLSLIHGLSSLGALRLLAAIGICLNSKETKNV